MSLFSLLNKYDFSLAALIHILLIVKFISLKNLRQNESRSSTVGLIIRSFMSNAFREREQNWKTTIVDSGTDACRSSIDAGRCEMIESTETTERLDDDQIRQKLLWAVKREVRADGKLARSAQTIA